MIKKISIALLVGFALSVAQADPVLLTPSPMAVPFSVGLSSQVGSRNVTHTSSGAFTDMFSITFDGPALISASLNTQALISAFSVQGVTFLDAYFQDALGVKIVGSDLNVISASLGGTAFEFGSIATPFLARDEITLVIDGMAGIDGVPASGSFSYSGSITGTLQNNVPEPSSIALAGLGLLGAVFASRRRRPR